MECVTVENVGHYFAEDQAEEEVLGNAPWEGGRGTDLEDGSGVEDLGEEQLCGCLERNADEDIHAAGKGDLPPSTFLSTLLITHW